MPCDMVVRTCRPDIGGWAGRLRLMTDSRSSLAAGLGLSDNDGVVGASEPVLERPLLRGVFHQVGFSVSLVVGTLLIVGADGAREHVSAAVFAGAVAVCFGSSALYHRITWTARLRLWMRRLDHAGVYLLIAGTYTPVCLLVLTGAWRWAVLAIVSAGAGAAAVFKLI